MEMKRVKVLNIENKYDVLLDIVVLSSDEAFELAAFLERYLRNNYLVVIEDTVLQLTFAQRKPGNGFIRSRLGKNEE